MKPYDISIRLSKEQSYSLLKGLVSVGGQLLDVFNFGYPDVAPLISIRIKIPEGKEKQFMDVSNIMLITPPSAKSHIEGNRKESA